MACVIASGNTRGADFAALPTKIHLFGPEGRQRVSIVSLRNQIPSVVLDVGRVDVSVADPGIALINDGIVTAVSDGETVLRVQVDEQTIEVPIVVANTKVEHQWSFRNDVQSVLAKSGCNMGACHGALAGKGGFRLSLRGYDPHQDFLSITRQARGRRIEMADPGRSLFLAKPTGALPHKGGLRLDVESRDYRVLSQWIANGANGPNNDDPILQRISVTPENAMLSPGDSSQVLVSAHYNDGRVVDVTHWAK
ncbi:MAG: S-layer protein, partial [Planctomycetales bacterium]|nr:S-layer protein [Planctomycetales bacterium]